MPQLIRPMGPWHLSTSNPILKGGDPGRIKSRNVRELLVSENLAADLERRKDKKGETQWQSELELNGSTSTTGAPMT